MLMVLYEVLEQMQGLAKSFLLYSCMEVHVLWLYVLGLYLTVSITGKIYYQKPPVVARHPKVSVS